MVIDPATEKYVDKYRDLMARLGADPASFARESSVPIRIQPTKRRVWQAG